MHYVKKSLTECRKIKAYLEERCRTCDRRGTKSCTSCYNIILRRDVELCIRRIESRVRAGPRYGPIYLQH